MGLTSAQDRIRDILAGAQGRFGVSARDLTTGEELGINSTEVFPLASVFKIPVLVELFRQADAGRVDLDRRLEFAADDRAPGSGVLRELVPGFALTIRDYALLMIILSDNSATDKVLRAIGAANVTPCMRELGLRSTWVSRSCAQILGSLAGIGSERPTPDEVTEILARLGDGRYNPNTWAYAETDENNASTPAEMVDLLELIYRGRAASPAACRAMLSIMRKQQLKGRIPLLLPPGVVTEHKTGTLPGVVNDAGLIYVTKDHVCALAVFSKGGADRARGPEVIGQVALAVYEAVR
jgi:beta-lactamase class A